VSTLIAVYNSDGCQGRCDAKCYDAHEPDCDCICGGRNHGAGKQQAIDNTREMAESWLEQARTDGQDITRAELAVTVTHEPLFNLADAGPAERQLENWNIHATVAARAARAMRDGDRHMDGTARDRLPHITHGSQGSGPDREHDPWEPRVGEHTPRSYAAMSCGRQAEPDAG